MARVHLALVLLLALLSVAGLSSASTFRYAWPDSGEVTVEIQRIRSTRRVAMRWTLGWHRRAAGTEFEWTPGELLALQAGGRDLDPASSLGRSVAALESVLPGWRIDAEGRLVGLLPRGLHDAVERARAAYLEELGEDDGYRAMTLDALDSPGLQLEAQRRVEDLWRSWVGEWIDLPRSAGSVQTDSVRTRYLDRPYVGERVRQVEALPHERGLELAHLRSTYTVRLDSLTERVEILESRCEEPTLRPIQTTRRISLGGDYEEQLVQIHWPDLPVR